MMKHCYLSKCVGSWRTVSPWTRPLIVYGLMLITLWEVHAQGITVKGNVISSEGDALPGVTVLIEGTAQGTVTDVDGNYTIKVPSENSVLTASFVGYQTARQEVNGRSVVDFNLEVDIKALEEVVVIGYGSLEKSRITTAISSIDQKELKNLPLPGVDQAIQGRLAGVTVSSNGGQPGGGISVRIRGITSVNNNEPLYVIDGVPIVAKSESLNQNVLGGGSGQTTQSALAMINPADIESIDVLKDASAQAIYGSRAANGVVLITTRKGQAGEGRITYDTYYGVSTIPKKLNVMNLRENAEYQASVLSEINQVTGGNQVLAEELQNPELLGKGTDWQDAAYQYGSVQSHLLSFSGGRNNTNYYFSTGVFDQKGILVGTDFKRYSLRVNVDHDIKDWLTVGMSSNMSRSNQQIGLADAFDAVTSVVLYNSPMAPVKDVNGDYVGQISVNGTYYGNPTNPVAQAKLRDVRSINTRIFGAVYGDIHFSKALSFRNELNYDFSFKNDHAFQPLVTNELYNTSVLTPSKLSEQRTNSLYWAIKSYLNYNRSFGKHGVFVTLGHEFQDSDYDYIQALRYNLTNNLPSLNAGDSENQSISAGAGQWSMESYFGRLNYSYDGRYSVSATIRADGSSNFGPNNKWGYFPAVSFSWTVSNEGFMSGVEPINYLKIRGGYGEVGNQDVSSGNSYSANVSLIANAPFANASRLYNVPNPNLSWESVKTTNLGVDMTLFNSFLDLTVDVYQKRTSDMLLNAQLGAYSGLGTSWDDIQTPVANAGQMTNRGIDIGITTNNLKGNLTWTTKLVFSHYKNKLDYLNNSSSAIYGEFDEYGTSNLVSVTKAGYPIGAFYGYVTDGLYTTEEELNSLETGLDVAPDGLWYGDVKFKDLDTDGDIDDADVTKIGDPNPDFTLGLTNSFSYKGFDLSIFIYGSFGADIFNYTRRQTEGLNSMYNNQLRTVLNRYSETNTDATMPRYNQWHNNNLRISDRYIEDGTYVRIQNIQFGYTFPVAWTSRVKVSSLKVYVSAQNLVTFTDYSGYSPEIGTIRTSATDGILINVDNGRYPVPRTFTVGANIQF